MRLPQGYTLVGPILPGRGGLLARAVRENDRLDVIVCTMPEGGHPELLTQHFDAELTCAEQNKPLPSPVCQRIDEQRRSWLLYRGVSGEPLDLSRPWSIESFWAVAPRLAKALGERHRHGLVHGRLDGNCIWLDLQSAEAPNLLGFVRSIDAAVVQELPTTVDTAPELFVRHRGSDLQSADIYSLGSVYYRMLAGAPPIVSTANMAFDVAANAPAPLDSTKVPMRLASLVQRMLSKAPAERPPSADQVYEELGAIQAGAGLPRFSLQVQPHGLVGRDAEMQALLNAANGLVLGSSRMVCLEGDPGVGKSCLLATLVRRLPRHAYLVGQGKFEQANQGQPYSAFLDACRNVLGSALSSDDHIFSSCRQRLLEGNLALLALLAPSMPELEHLCGDLPDTTEMGPVENRNRFNRACVELLGALSNSELPLVLALDDLHWADSATLALLKQLLTSGLPKHLLVVISCRTDAERPEIESLLGSLSGHDRIRVEPFHDAQTEEFCGVVVPNCVALPELAATVQQRSRGNALYCIELLRGLAASGQLTKVGEHWSYSSDALRFAPLSDSVIRMIRARLTAESRPMRYVLGAAAFIGSMFSLELLREATAFEEDVLREHIATAIRHGFIDLKPDVTGLYAFCHDRVQEAALAMLEDSEKDLVRLRLGRHYRTLAYSDQFALFHCLDHLNAVRDKLGQSELIALYALNLEAAKRARRSIAYRRAAELLQIYLESQLSEAERFDGLLLLAECVLLASGTAEATHGPRVPGETGQQILERCIALAKSEEQQLKLLKMRLALAVYNQEYHDAVEYGLNALQLIGQPLPARPSMLRVIARALPLMARMKDFDPKRLATLPESPPALLRETTLLGDLTHCAHWVRPNLSALLMIRFAELASQYRDNPQSGMGYACYSAMCHIQSRYETAVRFGRIAQSLAETQDPLARPMVRFQALTFYGAFEHSPRTLIAAYDRALAECISHGHLATSHLIDGAVTMLPHTGWNVRRIGEALDHYEREARTVGATTSIEAIGLVRAWCQLLQQEPASGDSARDQPTNPLVQPLRHQSFAGARDVMKMQIEYLRNNHREVLNIAKGARKHAALKDCPLILAGYSVAIVLATSRLGHTFGPQARDAMRCLKKLAAVRIDGEGPGTFRAPLLLAQGLERHSRKQAGGEDYLERAVDEAVRTGQALLKAMCLERLALIHAERGRYSLFVERMRDAAHAFQLFGAHSKVQGIVDTYAGLNWSHLAGRTTKQVGVQVEGVMRAASAIAEVTSTEELGPTLLRVIATTANALRAFLFVRQEGKIVMVAGCERDRADTKFNPTPLDTIAPSHLAVRAVRYVERTRESVELPRDARKFGDDDYLATKHAIRGLLCVPLTYRAELVAILYLEGSCSSESFSADEATLVTLLGRQAAIALTNSDTHRFEIEALQSKVNPHFLYNALSVVSDLIHREPNAAEDAILKLTKLYRYMLSTPANSRVPLEKELGLVRDYLELEKARFGGRLRIAWDVAANVSSVLVPALLLQPLAENAVNHGIRRNTNGGTVSISVVERDDTLLLTVSDDGPGWYEGRGGTGFGLRSVRRRLELMYGDRAQLSIIKRGGVSVRVALPW